VNDNRDDNYKYIKINRNKVEIFIKYDHRSFKVERLISKSVDTQNPGLSFQGQESDAMDSIAQYGMWEEMSGSVK